MYLTQENLEHTVISKPTKKELARCSGVYKILFEGQALYTWLSPLDYQGLLIAQRLRNVGMPTDFMHELEDYIQDCVNYETSELEAREDL